MEKEIKIKVSDLFVDIYKNFNVVSQVDKMKQLSKRELYLLLITCFDKHSDDDPVVIHNMLPFYNEAMDIKKLQLGDEGITQELLDLVKETDNTYISTGVIVDSNGNELPDPLNKQDVRDAKIGIIDNLDN